MLDLYRAELRRFRNGAAAFAAVNLLALAFLQQQMEITAAPPELHLVMLFFYTLAGCAFAAFQFGSYRAPSRWIWLLHRPMHRARILAALVGAALTLAALTVALPMFLVLAGQAHYTARAIDARHYAGAACLALAALAGWLGAGWFMLHRSRWIFLIVFLPIELCLHFATGTTAVGLWLACDVALLLLLYTAFTPGRTVAAGAAASLPGAAVLTLVVYVALMWGENVVLHVRQAVPSLAIPVTADGYRGTVRMTVPDRLRAGLGSHADTLAWRSELTPATAHTSVPVLRAVPVHDMVSNFNQLVFIQGEVKWTYSMDVRRFRGVNMRTEAAAGWFGPPQGFTGQPVAKRDSHGGNWLVDAHDLYALNDAAHTWRRVLDVDHDERLASGVAWAGPQRLLLTNRRVLLLQPAGDELAIARAIDLPVAFGDVATVDAAQVADGTLVSVLSGYRHVTGGAPPRQFIYLAAHDGTVREVARRDIAHTYPALFEHRLWWGSPVLHALASLPPLLIDNGALANDHAGALAPLLQPRPPIVWSAAIVALLLAGAGAAWWTGRSRMASGPRLAWCLACLVLGIPALLTLAILSPLPARTSRAVFPTNLEIQP
jgi:hypothetical protein